MRHKFAVLAILTLGIAPLSHIGWCNGETFLELRDPRTGVVLPLQQTPVRVEREQLEITLERYDIPDDDDLREIALDYHVKATYWLHNPTDEELVLKVAFPIPGGTIYHRSPYYKFALPSGVILRHAPVILDDQLVDWELLGTAEFLELHRPQIQKEINQIFETRKTLRTVLDKALAEFKKRPRSAQSSLVEELHSLISWEMIEPIKSQLQQEISAAKPPIEDSYYGLSDFWEAYLDLKGVRRASIWTLFDLAREYGNYRPPLISQWAPHKWFLAPASGRLIQSALWWGRRVEFPDKQEQWQLSLLMFEIKVKPQGRHRLTVRYGQPAGVYYYYGTNEGFSIDGFHFSYILKIRESWASFGPIEVTVRIPQEFRLRASPNLRFTGTSQGRRVYQATIKPYRQNLYIVAGPPEIFESPIIYNHYQDEEYQSRRFGTSHVYACLTQFGYHILDARLSEGEHIYTLEESSDEQWQLLWNEETQRARLISTRGKSVEVTAGQSKVVVNGKEVELPLPVRFADNRLWVPLRAWVNLLNEHLGMKIRLKYDEELGRVDVWHERKQEGEGS